MERTATIFEIFGGIRPMARTLGEPPSNVAQWKRNGRIPADKQPLILQRAGEIGVAITAEHVVFPLGRPAAVGLSDISGQADAVSFNPAADVNPEASA